MEEGQHPNAGSLELGHGHLEVVGRFLDVRQVVGGIGAGHSILVDLRAGEGGAGVRWPIGDAEPVGAQAELSTEAVARHHEPVAVAGP